MTPRRVICLLDNSKGTAVEEYRGAKFRVEWDEPTEHQDIARPKIPSNLIVWEDQLTS